MRAVSDASARLQTLLAGTLHDGGTYVEYRLPEAVPAVSFDRVAAKRCLASKTVAFVGDSRLRYLYASLVSLLGGGLDASQPRFRACPFSNRPQHVTHECSDWFSKCGDVHCHERELVTYTASSSRVRVAYVFNNFASTASRAQAVLRAHAEPTSLLIANVGAWGVMLSKGLAKNYNVSQRDVGLAHGAEESVADRLRFFQTLRSAHQDSPLAIAVGYPSCTCGGKHTRLCVNKFVFNSSVRLALREVGWLTYDPSRPTGKLWREREGGYGRAWSTRLLPKSALPGSEPKWDQCQSLHTFDTLADLELQILLNAVCKV